MAIANAAADKKALDIVFIKMKKVSSVCDFFVIASGASTTQVRAIADHISVKLKEKGCRLWHSEGQREASWILLDYGDVVVHVFLEEIRRFYDLERLWGDAPQEKFREKKPTKPKKPASRKRTSRKKKTKKR